MLYTATLKDSDLRKRLLNSAKTLKNSRELAEHGQKAGGCLSGGTIEVGRDGLTGPRPHLCT